METMIDSIFKPKKEEPKKEEIKEPKKKANNKNQKKDLKSKKFIKEGAENE